MESPVRPQDERLGTEDEEETDSEEEGQEAKVRREEELPSKEEVRKHMATHVPFRSWCPFCVAGKAKNNQHRKQEKEDERIPTVSVDYMYMNDDREREGRKDRDDRELGMPIMVIKDRKTRAVYAHVVPAKGNNQHAVKKLSQTLGELGHKKMILKSDQEPAMIELKELVKIERERMILCWRNHQ